MTVRFKVKFTDANVFFNEHADEREIMTATILIEPMVITWTEPSSPKPLDGPFYAMMDIAQEVALPKIEQDLTGLGFTHKLIIVSKSNFDDNNCDSVTATNEAFCLNAD